MNISNLIEQLEVRLHESIQKGDPKIESNEILFAIQRFKQQSADIKSKFQFSVDAASWLSKNLTEIVLFTSKLVFDNKLYVRNSGNVYISQEDYKNFQNDLYVLYVWIMRHLDAGGATPRLLKKEKLSLPVDYYFYKCAFERVVREMLVKINKEELSKDSIKLLVSYFNRFLIKRENQQID